MRDLTCPLCGLEHISTEWHLRKHLEGRTGIHRLSPGEADDAIARAGRSEGVPAGAGPQPLSANVPTLAELPKSSATTSVPRPADSHGAFLHDLFVQLAAYKLLPNYEFERRIDAVIAIVLPEILQQCLGWRVEVVVPQFPLKKAKNNQSDKVDYLLFRHASAAASEAWVFLELKTDRDSLKPEQWEKYVAAARRGMPALRDDLAAIVAKTRKHGKYRQLLTHLDGRTRACPIEILYLIPGTRAAPGFPRCIRVLPFSQLAAVRSQRYPETWDLFRAIILPTLC